MKSLIPVDSDSSLARDPVSNAVLVTDINKLHRYKQQKQLRKQMLEGKEEKIEMLNDKIVKLEELINTLINKNAQS